MAASAEQIRRFLQRLENTNLRGNHWLVKWFGRVLLPLPPDGVQVMTEFGFPLWVHPVKDHTIQTELYRTGSYEKGVLRWMQEWLRPGDCVVDVGAHIGLMTVCAAHCVGEQGMVYAFEPYPENHQTLLKNLAINRLERRVVASRQAIGDTLSRGKLFVPDRQSSSMAGLAEEGGGGVFVGQMDISPLSELIPTLPRLIKVDVEGYELPVLRGAEPILRRENPPAVIVECSNMRHNPHGGPLDIWAFFQRLPAYKAYRLSHGKSRYGKLIPISDVGELPEHDNVFFVPQ